jgi:hypothetical protein
MFSVSFSNLLKSHAFSPLLILHDMTVSRLIETFDFNQFQRPARKKFTRLINYIVISIHLMVVFHFKRTVP